MDFISSPEENTVTRARVYRNIDQTTTTTTPLERKTTLKNNQKNTLLPPTKKKGKLKTDQIVAIVVVSLVLVGVLLMVLAFIGVFNEEGPTVSLTPTVTQPRDLPVTVTIA